MAASEKVVAALACQCQALASSCLYRTKGGAAPSLVGLVVGLPAVGLVLAREEVACAIILLDERKPQFVQQSHQ